MDLPNTGSPPSAGLHMSSSESVQEGSANGEAGDTRSMNTPVAADQEQQVVTELGQPHLHGDEEDEEERARRDDEASRAKREKWKKLGHRSSAVTRFRASTKTRIVPDNLSRGGTMSRIPFFGASQRFSRDERAGTDNGGVGGTGRRVSTVGAPDTPASGDAGKAAPQAAAIDVDEDEDADILNVEHLIVVDDEFASTFIAVDTFPYFVIWHRSGGTKLWEVCLSVIVLYQIVLVPFMLSFLTAFEDPTTQPVWIAMYFVLVADFLRRFVTTYVQSNRDETTVVRDPRQIVRHYVYNERAFWIGLFSCTPVEFISWDGANGWLVVTVIAFRLGKLIYTFNIMQAGFARLFRLLAVILFIIHWVACAWHGIGADWMCPMIDECPPGADPHNYVHGAWELYTLSLRQTCMSLFASGQAVSPTEQVFFTFTTVLGAVLGASVFGSVAVLLSSLDEDENRFARFRQQVDSRMRYMGFPESLAERVRRYHDKIWMTNRTHGAVDEEALFDHLPRPLLCDIKQYNCKKLILSMQIFRAVDEIVVEEIVMRLQKQVFLEGDVVIRFGERGTWMGLIDSGKVVVTSGKNVVRVIGKGQYFGELGLLYGLKRTATVLSLTWVALYVFHRQDWQEVQEMYCDELLDLEDELQQYAAARKYIMKKAKKKPKKKKKKRRRRHGASGGSRQPGQLSRPPSTASLKTTYSSSLPKRPGLSRGGTQTGGLNRSATHQRLTRGSTQHLLNHGAGGGPPATPKNPAVVPVQLGSARWQPQGSMQAIPLGGSGHISPHSPGGHWSHEDEEEEDEEPGLPPELEEAVIHADVSLAKIMWGKAMSTARVAALLQAKKAAKSEAKKEVMSTLLRTGGMMNIREADSFMEQSFREMGTPMSPNHRVPSRRASRRPRLGARPHPLGKRGRSGQLHLLLAADSDLQVEEQQVQMATSRVLKQAFGVSEVSDISSDGEGQSAGLAEPARTSTSENADVEDNANPTEADVVDTFEEDESKLADDGQAQDHNDGSDLQSPYFAPSRDGSVDGRESRGSKGSGSRTPNSAKNRKRASRSQQYSLVSDDPDHRGGPTPTEDDELELQSITEIVGSSARRRKQHFGPAGTGSLQPQQEGDYVGDSDGGDGKEEDDDDDDDDDDEEEEEEEDVEEEDVEDGNGEEELIDTDEDDLVSVSESVARGQWSRTSIDFLTGELT